MVIWGAGNSVLLTREIRFFMRKSKYILVSVSLLAAVFLLGAVPPEAYCQDSSESNDGGVVVRKNADGSVDTFDETDPAVNGGNAAPQSQGGGGGEIRYGVHGAGKPYTKKQGDGVVVRRNADGSIETYDTSETTEYFPLAGSGTTKPAPKRRAVKRKKRSSTKVTSKAAAKKPAPKKK